MSYLRPLLEALSVTNQNNLTNLIAELQRQGLSIGGALDELTINEPFEEDIPSGYADDVVFGGIASDSPPDHEYKITFTDIDSTWDTVGTMVGQEVFIYDNANSTFALVTDVSVGSNWIKVDTENYGETVLSSYDDSTTVVTMTINGGNDVITYDDNLPESPTTAVSNKAFAYLTHVTQNTFSNQDIYINLLWNAASNYIVDDYADTSEVVVNGDVSSVVNTSDEMLVYYQLTLDGRSFFVKAHNDFLTVDNVDYNNLVVGKTTIQFSTSYNAIPASATEVFVIRNPIEKLELDVGNIDDTESFTEMNYEKVEIKQGAGSGFNDNFNRANNNTGVDGDWDGYAGDEQSDGSVIRGINSNTAFAYTTGGGPGDQAVGFSAYKYLPFVPDIDLYFDGRTDITSSGDYGDIKMVFGSAIPPNIRSDGAWLNYNTGLYIFIYEPPGTTYPQLSIGDNSGVKLSAADPGKTFHTQWIRCRVRISSAQVRWKCWIRDTETEPSGWIHTVNFPGGFDMNNLNSFSFGLWVFDQAGANTRSVRADNIDIIIGNRIQTQFKLANQSGQKLVMKPTMFRNDASDIAEINTITGRISSP